MSAVACGYAYVYVYMYVHLMCKSIVALTKVRMKNDSITVKDLTPEHIFRLPTLHLVLAPR